METSFKPESDIGQLWGTFMKASIPPTKWAVMVSSLSEYSKECLPINNIQVKDNKR